VNDERTPEKEMGTFLICPRCGQKGTDLRSLR
jgi:hypothetical protein